MKIRPHRAEIPLADGDLIRLMPWTFSFSTHGVPDKGLLAVDDRSAAATQVRSIAAEQVKPLQDDMLAPLLEIADGDSRAQDEARWRRRCWTSPAAALAFPTQR